MKNYEGLFIINLNNVKEEGIKDTLDKIEHEITASGGKVVTVQKMDKRSFSRVANRKVGAGFYANVIFELDPARLHTLRDRFLMHEDVFRAMFTEASPIKPTDIVAA